METRKDWERPQDRAFESFICPNCGGMYPTLGQDQGTCPTCGAECTREKCRVTFSSSEGF